MKAVRQAVVRYRGWLLFACIAFLGVRWWFGRNGPERVMDGMPSGLFLGMENGEAYFAEQLSSLQPGVIAGKGIPEPTVMVHAVRLPHGGRREVGRAPMDFPPELYDSGLYSLTVRTILRQTTVAHERSASNSALLRRIPLSGGPAQETATWVSEPGNDPINISTNQFGVAGDRVFWIRFLPDEPDSQETSRRSPHVPSVVTIRHSELWTKPLAGGSARRLAAGLSHTAPLLSGQVGVYWFLPEKGSLFHYDLYYCDAHDLIPRSLEPNCFKVTSPVALNGRHYWIEEPTFRQVLAGPNNLISVDRDGSDRRIVYRGETRMQPDPEAAGNIIAFSVSLSQLAVYRSHLYTVATEHRWINAEYQDASWLCLVHPVSRNVLEKLFALPGGNGGRVFFDNGYVYFFAEEAKSRWLDWTGNKRAGDEKSVLYRRRLPD